MIDVPLSRVTLGTMRLTKAGGVQQAAFLLDYARGIGVTSVHCSSEYESFPLFAEAWNTLEPARNAAVIVKVAVPHYGETLFSASLFREKTEAYLRALNVERVIVQWLLRYDLKQEEARLRIFHDGSREISEIVSVMKDEGKIAAFVGFPYTTPIADALVESQWCDGLALYVNAIEHDTDAAIDRCEKAGRPVIAIRPYAAGRTFAEGGLTAEQAMAHVFAHPPVTTAVVTASSVAHLDALRPYVA